LKEELGYEIISLHTLPELDEHGQPVINSVTGWPDSFFYDLDLALAVITPGLIAWCPEAFDSASQDKLAALPLEKITVSYDEARTGFACNLVSTGETIVMSKHAPAFKDELVRRGFKIITQEGVELSKGGGFIRCITLTLD
jgi:N-dimethylarginine dimethylaminohydrolase